MKNFLGIIIIIGLAVGGFFAYQKYESTNNTIALLNNELNQKEQQIAETQSLEKNIQSLKKTLTEKENSEKIYTILAGGDIMMDRGVEGKIKKLNKNYDFSFDLIRDELRLVDIMFANLEGSISDVGADTGKPYSFRFEPAVAGALSSAGINIVSLANNHMLDWGRESLCATTKHLDAVGINYVGAGCDSDQAEKPYITTLGNTRIGFLAYTEFYQGAHATENRPGMSEWDMKKIALDINDLKKEVDVVLISMHWGEEYKHRATDNQVLLGQQLVDAGADVVIGHHPHVDQEIERYNNGWIIYSLGNFVFDQSWSDETMQGLLAEIQIQNKRVYDIIPRPIQLNENYQPYLVK
jgi:poly-gamma-glutamate capsule biosynthesis protein CapA/YwtB (metallophosphatase superfamily)